MSDEIKIINDDAEPASPTTEEIISPLPVLKRTKLPLDLIPLVVLFIVVVIVILFANDWKFWDGQRGIEETNDAYVRADVTPLSTKVAGTVAKVFIDDFDKVKEGQLLVELRNDDFSARESQAKSTYLQANAAVNSVQKQIEVQNQIIENARLALEVSKQEVPRSVAQTSATQATVVSASDSVKAAKSETAAATAKLRADQAVELRAFPREAATRSFVCRCRCDTTDESNKSSLSMRKQKQLSLLTNTKIARLSSLEGERSAETSRQNSELESSRVRDIQSKLLATASGTLLLSEQSKLAVLDEKLHEAKLDAASKLQSWNEAKVELDYTKIRAPVAGTLSERRVRAGQQVNAGTQVITIVSSTPWVIASYRETQMRRVRVGDKAEVSVDALGGEIFRGAVQSLSPASEAQFALLPPDNPSGNFTKITQRIPVKITFPDQTDAEKERLAHLKSGMTVISKIWTR